MNGVKERMPAHGNGWKALTSAIFLLSCHSRQSEPARDSISDAGEVGVVEAGPGSIVLGDATVACNADVSLEVYETRIAPLFADERPSSCSQCHLSGIDLGSFARGTPCETFACLTEQHLIDPDRPAESEILSWIGRAAPQSELITEQVIAEEYAGFRDWITYNVECGACEGVVCPLADPASRCRTERPDFDPDQVDAGGCGSRALELTFNQTVYAQRGRCSPCHFNNHEDENAPQWIEVAFDCNEASLRTLRNVITKGYINSQDPDASLLLLKPLNIIPHHGGAKFEDEADEGYAAFKYFIDYYIACQQAP